MADLLSPDMLNICSLHICRFLRFPDLLALGQTCNTARQLCLLDLPASVWTLIAKNSLPGAHPWLSRPGKDIRGLLERSAGAKRVLPLPRKLGERCRNLEMPSCVVPNRHLAADCQERAQRRYLAAVAVQTS